MTRTTNTSNELDRNSLDTNDNFARRPCVMRNIERVPQADRMAQSVTIIKWCHSMWLWLLRKRVKAITMIPTERTSCRSLSAVKKVSKLSLRCEFERKISPKSGPIDSCGYRNRRIANVTRSEIDADMMNADKIYCYPWWKYSSYPHTRNIWFCFPWAPPAKFDVEALKLTGIIANDLTDFGY